MNFNEVNEYLQNLFSEIDFFKVAKQPNGLHSYKKTTELCGDGAYISVSYPGYKAKNGKTRDYRVNIHRGDFSTSLSHVNIVVDIYNKIQNGMDVQEFIKALIEFIKDGDINVINNLHYDACNSPSDDLIAYVVKAHPVNKIEGYNRKGNLFDWTLDELFISIKWIAVQEDINYPNGMGRKMSFLRYIEAIFVSVDTTHTLGEVINRTLAHNIPDQWKEIKPIKELLA